MTPVDEGIGIEIVAEVEIVQGIEHVIDQDLGQYQEEGPDQDRGRYREGGPDPDRGQCQGTDRNQQTVKGAIIRGRPLERIKAMEMLIKMTFKGPTIHKVILNPVELQYHWALKALHQNTFDSQLVTPHIHTFTFSQLQNPTFFRYILTILLQLIPENILHALKQQTTIQQTLRTCTSYL